MYGMCDCDYDVPVEDKLDTSLDSIRNQFNRLIDERDNYKRLYEQTLQELNGVNNRIFLTVEEELEKRSIKQYEEVLEKNKIVKELRKKFKSIIDINPKVFSKRRLQRMLAYYHEVDSDDFGFFIKEMLYGK